MMELREQIARKLAARWGDDIVWTWWLEHADVALEVLRQQKPVAWQMSHPSLGDGWLDTNEAHAEWLRANKYGEWKVRPLYAAPGAHVTMPEDIYRDAMRYRALRNNPLGYPAVFAHPGADDYGWFSVDGADLDEVTDELLAAPKPENP